MLGSSERTLKLCGLGLKCREFFALARNALALVPTELLRRFFSVLSGDGRPFPELIPLRLSLRGGPSEDGGEGDVEVGGDAPFASVDCGGADEVANPVCVCCRVLVLVGIGVGVEDDELEPLPNILFSNPPWEEKLLLCLPASVLGSV